MASPSTQIRLAFIGSCLAIAVAAGCSSTPTTPSPAAVATSTTGAVIAGAVAGAQASDLTVRVMGTNLSAAVGATGTFEMSGVPAGTARLQFSSAAVNATADITNVTIDQYVALQIQVNGASVAIVSDTRSRKVSLCHAEGNGDYHLIDVSDSAEAAHRAHGDGKPGEPVPGHRDQVFGRDCRPVGPSVAIKKYTNGEDADREPGPSILVGDPVTWEYRVTNTGTVTLTGITVVDDQGVDVVCASQSRLVAGASMTCTGTGVATLGQYRNLGTVTASWAADSAVRSISDSDPSHYVGVASIEGPKVTLCHRTGNGSYVMITVGASAEPAHRAHGDGAPGEAVPGLPGNVFGPSCSVR